MRILGRVHTDVFFEIHALPIVRAVGAVEFDGAGQTLTQVHPWFPAQLGLDTLIAAVDVAYVYFGAFRWEGFETVAPGPGDLYQGLNKFQVADGLRRA